MTGTNSLVVVILAAAMASLGCGDSGSGGNSNLGGSGGSGGSGTGAAGSGAAGPGSTGPGSGGAMECGPASIDMNDPCEVCAGTKCTDAALTCCEQTNAAAEMGKLGCLDIIACVQETGCDSANPNAADGCLQPSPTGCNETIMNAGLAVALGEASALGDCVQTECAAECGIGGAGGAGGAGGGP